MIDVPATRLVDIVTQLLTAHPAVIDPPSRVVVEAGEHKAGSAVHVPTKGDGIYYWLRFRAQAADGEPVVCRPLMYLHRPNSTRGDPSPLTGRLVGDCQGE